MMIEHEHQDLSLRQQCELLSLARSGLYYVPVIASEEKYRVMGLIDEIYTSAPFMAIEGFAQSLQEEGSR